MPMHDQLSNETLPVPENSNVREEICNELVDGLWVCAASALEIPINLPIYMSITNPPREPRLLEVADSEEAD